MPLLTVDDLRQHITTSLSDDALQRILDANEAAIVAAAGELGVPVTEIHYESPYSSIILTKRRFQSTTSPDSPTVVMGYGLSGAITLASDDFYLTPTAIRRRDFGTNPGIFFDTPVAITGTPVDDSDLRILALISLCKLDVEFQPGLRAQTVGKHRDEFFAPQEGGDYISQRNDILAALAGGQPLFAGGGPPLF